MEAATATRPASQLTFNVGGESPTSATLSLQGGALDVGREYEKGDTVRMTNVEVEIREVAFRDKVDPKTGVVVSCKRKQIGVIVGYELADD